ncbi:hypothetical protein CRI93_01375 [Longimonas halophila]|uniref:Uncharacterized protein n=1 Tax=Longimonas halophila TaxID=1469170 RepID=A0A2H3NWT9_9BACT|nr:hypothetical protein CRI93_01375 [Longimonas halophila]
MIRHLSCVLILLIGLAGCDTTTPDRSTSAFNATIEGPEGSFTLSGSALLLNQRTTNEVDDLPNDLIDLFDGKAIAEIRASASHEGVAHTLDFGYISDNDLATDTEYLVAAQTPNQPVASPDSIDGVSVIYRQSTSEGVNLYLIDEGEMFTEYVDEREVQARIVLEARSVMRLDDLPPGLSPLFPILPSRIPADTPIDTLDTPLTLDGTFTALSVSR